MIDIPQAAIDAARAARYGEPTDVYTWDLVVDRVLAAAAPHIAAAVCTGTCEERQADG